MPSRKLFVLPLVVVALATIGIPAASAVSPITPRNRPTPLSGAVNGEVPMTRLVRVVPNCVAAREAAPSLMRIFMLARASKVGLGAEECYRSLAEEVRLANQAQQPGNNPACVASVSHTTSGAPVGNSYHGWGKAVDLSDHGNELTFASPGYAFMKRVAGSVGWNHPAFAEPGGSACPEPWHWEWVGDGGTIGAAHVRGDVVALLPSADDHGYATVTGLGALRAHGDFSAHGSVANLSIAWVVIGGVATPNRGGYWMVAADGGVFSFGNAHFHGSLGNRHINSPINGMASTKHGNGYWLVAWDGGVFSFGDAHFYGSTGAMHLNFPVVGMAPTPSGRGYWLVASDGGVFSFGDAHFYGSTGNLRLASPVVGMAPTPSGHGYWLVAADGGVFTFGDAHFYGSLGASHASSPAVAIARTRTGRGYWIELADGTVAAYGDAHHYGNG
jgi:hypothetical protein